MAIEKWALADRKYQGLPNPSYTSYFIELGTATTGDTLTVNLGSIGVGTFKALNEWIHTTTDSVIIKPDVSEYTGYAPATTAVSSGVLTITLGTRAAATTKHVVEIIGTNGG